ncbi:MAG TPA: cysteine desulfurase family protein [Acidimicrobiales bacterium]|nr:cysteine desulfurase family protein [Acidimicrobiales bacterium]
MSECPTTYLDHAATTPLRAEVAGAMAAVLAEPLGNPTGSHRPAQRARRFLEEARDAVAGHLGRDPREIIFTSGGTESANLAVFGTLAVAQERGRSLSILHSAVEHPAVLESCRAAHRSMELDLAELPVNAHGVVELDALIEAVTPTTTLVAIMLANNETGVIQPIDEVARIVRAASESTWVFADAVQATPFLNLAEQAVGADLLALSAHKVGGPVGTGVLAVRPPAEVRAYQHGGGQERERRSGTQDVVGAVGLAAALGLAEAERIDTGARIGALRNQLASRLLAAIPGAVRTVADSVPTLPGHLHLCLPGIEREELLVLLGRQGICASGGSSCASGALQTSHVLTAMGVPDSLAQGAIRFTLGHETTSADIDRAVAVMPGVVAALRHDP